MAIGRTDTDYKPVNAMDSTLSRNELIALSAANPEAQFYTPYGVIIGGVVVADKALWHNEEFTLVETDLLLDNSGGGIVVAFPSSSDAAKDFADYTLQAEITDLPDIRSGANKGNQAMEIINSRDNVAAQPYKVKYGITANGGKVSDNAASIKALRGDTAVWNQSARVRTNTITQNGITVTNDGVKSTVVGTAEAFTVISLATASIAANHKCLLGGCPSNGSASTFYFSDGFNHRDYGQGVIFTTTEAHSDTWMNITIVQGTTVDFVIYPVLYDLTLMFGAGNEPATVEEYYERKPIVADESAYNEGQLASFGPTWGVRCSVGGSDLVWEQELGSTWGVNSGDLTVNGDSIIVTATGAWPSLYTVAPFKQGHKYLVVCGIQSPLTDTVVIGTPNNGNAQYREVVQANTDTTIVAFLDCTESYNEFYIYPNWNVAASGEEFTITRPQRYDLTETFGAGNEPTTIDELRQHLPRITSTKHFDISSIFPHGLNKVGSVRDEMYYDSARRTWVAVHRVGVVDLGLQEEWYYRPDLNISESGAPIYTSVFVTRVYGKKNGNTNNLACSRYPIKEGYINDADKVCNDMSYTNLKDVNIVDSSFTDVDSFRAAMQGVLLCYELAEPVIEDVPFFDSFYNAYEGGTEEIVADTPTTAMDADIAYQYDDRGRIDFIYSKIKSL